MPFHSPSRPILMVALIPAMLLADDVAAAPMAASASAELTISQALLLLAVVLLVLYLLRSAIMAMVWTVENGWSRGLPWLGRRRAVRRTRPALRWIKIRWPRLYRFVAARFDPHRFAGLPLTLLIGAALYLAFLFVGLVEAVLESDEISAIDDWIIALVAPWRWPPLVLLFDWITEFGSMETLTAVAVVATAFLWARGPRRYIAPVWLTVIGSQVTTFSGKYLIARPRPEFLLEVSAQTPSFPSGHATGAMAVYGIIAYAILRDLPQRRQRLDAFFGTAVLIVAIAFSRIFLSVHYPSDVAAGLLVGLFWLLAGIALAEMQRPLETSPAAER